jgi:methyl-accepting chemotaxis protein
MAFGNEALAVLYFLVVVPYSFDRGRALGYYSSIASTAAFLASSWFFVSMNPMVPQRIVWTGAAAGLLLLISLQIVPIASKLIQRIRYTRDRISEAEDGNLGTRADHRYSDELGFLQRSFNGMVEQLGTLIGTVQGDSHEMAAAAGQLAATTHGLNETGSGFTDMAQKLTSHLESQRALTATGRQRTDQALVSSERLRERAEEMESNARGLVDTAQQSRDSIARASDTLVAIGTRVRAAATTVSALGEASERVGDFVDAVSRIARQTNLLALNAAIEAARAGEHGRGFAVVAEEVRKLAEESGRAAKAITITIAEVRDNIATAVQSMTDGEQEVRGVGDIADEANSALSTLLAGIGQIAELIADVAAVSRDQSATMRQLAEVIEGVQGVSLEAATHANDAAAVATTQMRALEGLTDTSRTMAKLAERLRHSTGRFTIAPAAIGEPGASRGGRTEPATGARAVSAPRSVGPSVAASSSSSRMLTKV